MEADAYVVGHYSGIGPLRHVVPPPLSAPLLSADRGGQSISGISLRMIEPWVGDTTPIDPIGVALLQVLYSARLVVCWDIASDWLSDYLPLFTERSVVNRGSTAQPGRGWSLMLSQSRQWHRTPPPLRVTSPISSATLRGQGRTIHFRYFVADD